MKVSKYTSSSGAAQRNYYWSDTELQMLPVPPRFDQGEQSKMIQSNKSTQLTLSLKLKKQGESK